jgi:hypothetical protein
MKTSPITLVRLLIPVLLAVGMSSSFAAVEWAAVKLGGKQFGNKLEVEADSGVNLISKSKIYRYKTMGKVRGKKGALRKAFPQSESLAKFMDTLQAGSSASLQGRYENPSAGLPVALYSKSVSGSRRIKGFGKVRISMTVSSSIDDKGLVVLRVNNLTFANKDGKLKGTMSFRSGKVVVHTAPVMSFKSNNHSVDENAGAIELIVVRDGFRGMPASVQFATSDSSAKAGTDYETATGVISFAANEFEKAITIPIIDNAVKDKPRQFSVILTNPSDGSVLGQTVTATVRIMNEDK